MAPDITDLVPLARRLLTAAVGLHASAFRVTQQVVWGSFDLALRLWLSQAFFVSGVLKLTHWDTALLLATNVYAVDWMSPVAAAYTGVTIEVAGAALLTVGLFTRPAAAAMLALSLVAQFAYKPFDTQLLSAALLGWFVVVGAGPISFDRAFSGLAESAIPLAGTALRAAAWVRGRAGPVYQLLLRLWLAAALAVAASSATGAPTGADAAMRWLPIASAPAAGLSLTLAASGMLALGLATRYAAVGLVMAASMSAMTGAWHTDDTYWVLGLALLAFVGAGPWSADRWIETRLKQRYPELDGKPAFSLHGLPRVVILGAGFGGLSCAAALRRVPVTVTLIDRTNHHLFQPLLYQVATASLSPADIATPIRSMFREAFNTQVLFATVTGVDAAARVVMLGDQRVPYDYLVVATGATHSYFGKDEWQVHAPGLKRIEDATEIRRRLLIAFEKAEATEDESERRALLTFLVVGGGPTGVELAGAIADLARLGMEKEFRRFDPAATRVILVQSAPRVLPTFPQRLSGLAQASLERLGVEVLTGSRVENIDEEGVRVSGQRVAARTVLWAAGVMASPAAEWLGVAADKAGRIKVDAQLAVPGLENVFAIGDTAASQGWKGQPVPGLAPAAKQGGAYVARMIRARVGARTAPPAFAYRHIGSLATIGRRSAVVECGRVQLWGATAWWLWGMVHVGLLVGVRNRVATVINWFWSYLTFRSAIRLITAGAPTAAAGSGAVESRSQSQRRA
jgi:putative oxidoreductase